MPAPQSPYFFIKFKLADKLYRGLIKTEVI